MISKTKNKLTKPLHCETSKLDGKQTRGLQTNFKMSGSEVLFTRHRPFKTRSKFYGENTEREVKRVLKGHIGKQKHDLTLIE